MNVIPQFIKATCYACNTLTVCKQKIVKKGKASSLTMIARRQKRKGHNNNLGKFSEGVIKKYMKGRKPMILMSCTICGRSKYRTLKRSITTTVKKAL